MTRDLTEKQMRKAAAAVDLAPRSFLGLEDLTKPTGGTIIYGWVLIGGRLNYRASLAAALRRRAYYRKHGDPLVTGKKRRASS